MYYLKRAILVGLLVMSTSVASAREGLLGGFDSSVLEPYFGVDFQNRYMKYKAGEGSQLFKKNALQGNVFLGFKFHENFGLEVGYEQTKKKQQDVTLNLGEQNIGDLVAAADAPVVYETRARLQGWHASLMGFLPLRDYCENVSLFAGVGVARIRAKLERTLLSRVGATVSRATQTFSNNNIKYVLRLTGGVQYLLLENIGIRGLVTYENTSKIKPHAINSAGVVRTIRLKDSFIYGLGIFYKFW